MDTLVTEIEEFAALKLENQVVRFREDREGFVPPNKWKIE